MAFLQTSGTDFILDGAKWVPFGGSTYDIKGGGYQTQIDNKWAAAVSMNLNMVRMVNFFSIGDGKDETQWSRADYGLDKARQLGLKVLLDLSDYCSVTGGITGEHCSLPSSRDNWVAFVTWVFNRVNTINGRTYKDDDTIGIIAISGENSAQDGLTLREFFSTVSAAIKATGAQQIVHAGGQIPEIILSTDYEVGFQIQQDMLTIPTIDCVSTHPYYTQQNMRDLFPMICAYSKEKNKPWFIEEFGYNQSVASSRPDKHRAMQHRFVFDIGLKNNCAGFLFWNIDTGFYNEQTQSGGGFGINVNTPETFKMIQRYSKYKRYSARIPV